MTDVAFVVGLVVGVVLIVLVVDRHGKRREKMPPRGRNQ